MFILKSLYLINYNIKNKINLLLNLNKIINHYNVKNRGWGWGLGPTPTPTPTPKHICKVKIIS